MSAEPSDPIDYTPEPLPRETRFAMLGALVNRMIREFRQEDAAERNALVRKAEDDRRRRQPGNTPV